MLRLLSLTLIVGWIQAVPVVEAQQSQPDAANLERRYAEGAVSHYAMTANNDGWVYSARATDVVKRDANGRYYEEIGWSEYRSDGQQALTPASLALRQTVSLDDAASYMRVPNLAGVQPMLIGPITDTLTFYSDLLLAMKSKLTRVGQTAYVARMTPNSWADGQRVLLGQDVVDFSLKVENVDAVEHTETLLIEHVPPPALHVKLPAAWMQEPGTGAPNNFVQVSKDGDSFTAEMGKETFEVRLLVDTRDGHMLSATMHNPVVLKVRACKDEALLECGAESPKTIVREVSWKLVP